MKQVGHDISGTNMLIPCRNSIVPQMIVASQSSFFKVLMLSLGLNSDFHSVPATVGHRFFPAEAVQMVGLRGV